MENHSIAAPVDRYPDLRRAINSIQIIDDHAHPGLSEYFEQIPRDQTIPFITDTFKTPQQCDYGFPYLRELHYDAYQQLYGFSRDDIDDPSQLERLSNEYEVKRRDIHPFLDVIMKQAGVDKVIANIALPASLSNKPNVPFIPWLDPLIMPFDNTHLKQRTLGKWYIGADEFELNKLKQRYDYVENGFAGYLAFIDRVLDDYIQQGCVGFKFLLATQRNTRFAKVPEQEGPLLYQHARDGAVLSYTRLQDLLVWHVMRKAVDYDVPVQYHFAVIDTNTLEYYDPLNLSNMVDDQELKHAKIVILHNGYPRFSYAETLALGGLVTANNVYLDISGRIMFGNHPKVIAKMLRTMLEKPLLWKKILYGSDALWGERYIYTCAKTIRDALYFVLCDMIDDQIINGQIAIEIANNILRDTALKLYKL